MLKGGEDEVSLVLMRSHGAYLAEAGQEGLCDSAFPTPGSQPIAAWQN